MNKYIMGKTNTVEENDTLGNDVLTDSKLGSVSGGVSAAAPCVGAVFTWVCFPTTPTTPTPPTLVHEPTHAS